MSETLSSFNLLIRYSEGGGNFRALVLSRGSKILLKDAAKVFLRGFTAAGQLHLRVRTTLSWGRRDVRQGSTICNGSGVKYHGHLLTQKR